MRTSVPLQDLLRRIKYIQSRIRYCTVQHSAEVPYNRFHIEEWRPNPYLKVKWRFKKDRRVSRGSITKKISPLHGSEPDLPDPAVVPARDLPKVIRDAVSKGGRGHNRLFWQQMVNQIREHRDVLPVQALSVCLSSLVAADYRSTDLMRLLQRGFVEDADQMTLKECVDVATSYAHFNCLSKALMVALENRVTHLVSETLDDEEGNPSGIPLVSSCLASLLSAFAELDYLKPPLFLLSAQVLSRHPASCSGADLSKMLPAFARFARHLEESSSVSEADRGETVRELTKGAEGALIDFCNGLSDPDGGVGGEKDGFKDPVEAVRGLGSLLASLVHLRTASRHPLSYGDVDRGGVGGGEAYRKLVLQITRRMRSFDEGGQLQLQDPLQTAGELGAEPCQPRFPSSYLKGTGRALQAIVEQREEGELGGRGKREEKKRGGGRPSPSFSLSEKEEAEEEGGEEGWSPFPVPLEARSLQIDPCFLLRREKEEEEEGGGDGQGREGGAMESVGAWGGSREEMGGGKGGEAAETAGRRKEDGDKDENTDSEDEQGEEEKEEREGEEEDEEEEDEGVDEEEEEEEEEEANEGLYERLKGGNREHIFSPGADGRGGMLPVSPSYTQKQSKMHTAVEIVVLAILQRVRNQPFPLEEAPKRISIPANWARFGFDFSDTNAFTAPFRAGLSGVPLFTEEERRFVSRLKDFLSVTRASGMSPTALTGAAELLGLEAAGRSGRLGGKVPGVVTEGGLDGSGRFAFACLSAEAVKKMSSMSVEETYRLNLSLKAVGGYSVEPYLGHALKRSRLRVAKAARRGVLPIYSVAEKSFESVGVKALS
uniref:Uncharacterized protein n=1 Tax=Chromera velia CCMP2878 TaxID=1169474 RepID=A0A0G4F660_9ALVE|eukprot:Cvel_15235.t1-p1 / transcript=Cvel_15235.t1 / gene=Cvel_15235 / organism=Chromera_velia_CCMP2878 / gene_product=hypothetical protein / transcript_product=hypothetical protein / location=Cvel_scaffold1115:16818-19977(-) / protein_length=827 / sequence_SO=supercontig / SO=protein_coding / is_pseudo=false